MWKRNLLSILLDPPGNEILTWSRLCMHHIFYLTCSFITSYRLKSVRTPEYNTQLQMILSPIKINFLLRRFSYSHIIIWQKKKKHTHNVYVSRSLVTHHHYVISKRNKENEKHMCLQLNRIFWFRLLLYWRCMNSTISFFYFSFSIFLERHKKKRRK